jgi:hypothetical protein
MSNNVSCLANLVLIAISSCGVLYGDKVCPGTTCSVPDNCDCTFYREAIVTTPILGGEIPHTGVLIRVFSSGNPFKNNQTLRGSLSHAVEDLKEIEHQITNGGEISSDVKASVGLPLVGKGEATVGVKYNRSVTDSGTQSEKTIDTANWSFEVPSCERHSANLLGDWVEGKWSSTGFKRGYYYSVKSDGPIQTVECSRVSGVTVAKRKFKIFYIEARKDEKGVCSGY